MNETEVIADAHARRRALDPESSFIVQAPAGSGKTELLIQRFLTLLARVDAPEEIVAITFTRKAAGEMRDRVLRALALAADSQAPEHDQARVTWALARAARQRDAQKGWGVVASASRLRIQTIDSLCAGLTRQMPIVSGFGAQAEPVDNPAPLYREAARRTLGRLDQTDEASVPVADNVGRVLSHLDNNVETAEALLAEMLARRDQWLRHVADRDSPRIRREALEGALASAIRAALEEVHRRCPPTIVEELVALARYAAGNLAQTGSASPIVALAGLGSLPRFDLGDLPLWRGIAELLLTKDNEIRKQIAGELGFPAPSRQKEAGARARSKAYKDRIAALLSELFAHTGFVDALVWVRQLPPAEYTDAQWAVLEALTGLLPWAVAELVLLFRERGQVDFTAVSQAAVRALGGEDEPTDLALALDYRIRHLLVDEFQDTSLSQFELLEHLTAGWQHGDGRTLFVVGDPMQSIYRFREAQVGLYLQAWHGGVGALALEPLALQVNFRSQRGIVRWVNEAFRTVLSEVEDRVSGAVPFAPSQATHTELPGMAVAVHPMLRKDRMAEAEIAVGLVQQARTENPPQRIAILVRSRSHLSAIVPALKAAGLRFQAIEIEQLGHRAVVQDLYALTRALLHPADRIAWLSALRAPWCGLSLADLDVLAGHDHRVCMWDLMDQAALVERLSADGQARLTRLRERLRPCFEQRRREPLRRWIEGAWLALGGPATAGDPADLEDASVFLGVLEELEEGGDLVQFDALAERVSQLFALPDSGADDTLQLMTMHRAKGLEFDTVILPGLGYPPRPNDARLLLWAERPHLRVGAELLLAPIRSRAQERDPLYRYLGLLEDVKAKHEDGRLLYVAATRARSRLHLIGHAEVRKDGPSPSPRSLLARLWPVVEADYRRALADASAVPIDSPPAPAAELAIRRFPVDWGPPAPPAAVVETSAWSKREGAIEQVEFSWVSESARHVGTVVHRTLQAIAEQGLDAWSVERVAATREIFARDLRLLGVPEMQLEGALERVLAAVSSTLADPRARWILSPHAHAQSELRLTGLLNGALVDAAIDRTFVDDRDVRWIVDFKTGSHEGSDPEGFLDNERLRYREQLERYAALLGRMESRAIRLALYFPLLKGWREWEYAVGGDEAIGVKP